MKTRIFLLSFITYFVLGTRQCSGALAHDKPRWFFFNTRNIFLLRMFSFHFMSSSCLKFRKGGGDTLGTFLFIFFFFFFFFFAAECLLIYYLILIFFLLFRVTKKSCKRWLKKRLSLRRRIQCVKPHIRWIQYRLFSFQRDGSNMFPSMSYSFFIFWSWAFVEKKKIEDLFVRKTQARWWVFSLCFI